MRILSFNIMLALVWLVLSGEWNFANFVGGFAVGAIALWVGMGGPAWRSYIGRSWRIVSFAAFFLYELVLSNLRLATDILRPKPRMTPAILAVPLEVTTDLEIVLLANLITLTPGTLSLDVSANRKTLYVHAVYAMSPDEAVREIKEGLERRVLEVCR